MSIVITEACINCGACEPVCPNTAIYSFKVPWRFSDGTALKGELDFDGFKLDADAQQEAISDKFFYIAPDKCTTCKGHSGELGPSCQEACPVSCCIPDLALPEGEQALWDKAKWLHNGQVKKTDGTICSEEEGSAPRPDSTREISGTLNLP